MSDLFSKSKTAICPGQAALFPNEGGKHYLRVAFTVYWEGAYPSTEIFYLTEHPIKLSLTAIATLEQEILTLLTTTDTNASPLNVVYLSYTGVELSDDEVTTAGWRVIAG